MEAQLWSHSWIHPEFGETTLWFRWHRTPRGHVPVLAAIEWDLFTPESERAQLQAALVMEHPEWFRCSHRHEGGMDEDMEEYDLPF